MAGGNDLAPWEQVPAARASSRQQAVPQAKTPEPPYVAPKDDQLPEIMRPEERGVVIAAERTVPRPTATPRALEGRAQMVLAATLVTGIIALAGTGFCFVVLPAELGVVKLGLGLLALLVAMASFAVIGLEYGRIMDYRTRAFFPALLAFGTLAQFEKVVGSGGLPALAVPPVKAGGRGLLSRVFDRSAHLSSPPEVVALLVERGSGPEFVPVPWDAVNTVGRGEVVWYSAKGAHEFLLFHLFVPFAPQIVTDKDTRLEIFKALKVGRSMHKQAPKSIAMTGQAKAMKVDRDGNLIVDKGEPEAEKPRTKTDPGLAPLGASSPHNPQRSPSGRRPAAPQQPPQEKFRIADAGKPLGGSTNPEDYGDDAGK